MLTEIARCVRYGQSPDIASQYTWKAGSTRSPCKQCDSCLVGRVECPYLADSIPSYGVRINHQFPAADSSQHLSITLAAWQVSQP